MATETPISEDWEPTKKTSEWLQREYPQLDPDKTVTAFIEWASNQRDNNKRSATYGQVLQCFNWQMKFRNVIRIQVINKWSSIAIPRQGHEVDTRWSEVLTHAKAIGCPLQRRTIDTVEGFRTRVRAWETYDKPRNSVIDFGSAMKVMR